MSPNDVSRIREPVEHRTDIAYRADIDGLRAIAVLAVVGFHAFPDLVEGGFIGVDIFFVISGFLISTIIFERLSRDSFSFIEFYSHRITRIFPALFLVLIASFTFGWFALLSDEYMQLGKHIAGGAGFVSNFVLMGESGYFDNSGETKPLLHLWSLGIEEQFYILWPLLLWLVWKVRINALVILIALGLISFALNINKVNTDAVAAFYLPGTRFWELLAGSALAFVSLYKRNAFGNFPKKLHGLISVSHPVSVSIQNGRAAPNVLALLGIVLISVGILTISKELVFPGWLAILPVVGTVLIIVAGPRAWINRTVLSSRLLVWFGLVSFPLYLWHWPILSFARILVGDVPPLEVRIAAVVISTFLAWMTYKFIEGPIRFNRESNVARMALLGLMVFVGSIGFYAFKKDGLTFRYNPTINDYSVRATQLDGDGIVGCTDMVLSTRSAFCAKTSATPRIALVGDSHARHLFHGFVQSESNKFNRLIYIGASACQPTLGVEHREGCDNNLLTAIDFIRSTPSIEYVVLSSWHIYVDSAAPDLRRAMMEGYDRTIKSIKKANKKIVFVIDTPSLSKIPEICVESPLPIRAAFKKTPSFCNGADENDMVLHTEYDKVIKWLHLAHPDVIFYDPFSLFCSEGKCKVFDGAKILYADEHHLSNYGSQYVVNDLVKKLEALER